jgi:hypothetical protein
VKTGTILLLLLIVAVVAACSNTPGTAIDTIQTNSETGDTQTGATADTPANIQADTTNSDNALTIDDQAIQQELTADPPDDIGTLDNVPVDDSVPK